jgi:hypothetical protein
MRVTWRIMAAAALMLILAGVAGMIMTRPRGDEFAIEGSREHDVGLIRFDWRDVTIEHAFPLINRSGKTIHPVRLAMFCGCLNGEFDLSPWPDGESRSLLLRLSLRDFGRQSAMATIISRDAPEIAAVLNAAGCPSRRLEVADGVMRLDAEGAGHFVVRLLTMDEVEPAPPVLTADPPAELRFEGWVKQMEAVPSEGVPARFRARIAVKARDARRFKVVATCGNTVVERTLFPLNLTAPRITLANSSEPKRDAL